MGARTASLATPVLFCPPGVGTSGQSHTRRSGRGGALRPAWYRKASKVMLSSRHDPRRHCTEGGGNELGPRGSSIAPRAPRSKPAFQVPEQPRMYGTRWGDALRPTWRRKDARAMLPRLHVHSCHTWISLDVATNTLGAGHLSPRPSTPLHPSVSESCPGVALRAPRPPAGLGRMRSSAKLRTAIPAVTTTVRQSAPHPPRPGDALRASPIVRGKDVGATPLGACSDADWRDTGTRSLTLGTHALLGKYGAACPPGSCP